MPNFKAISLSKHAKYAVSRILKKGARMIDICGKCRGDPVQ